MRGTPAGAARRAQVEGRRARGPRPALEAGRAPFLGFLACSWMPHWACPYDRLETGSSFVVGSWTVTPDGSRAFLALYGGLVAWTLATIAWPATWRLAVLASAVFHGAIGLLHAVRVASPFDFVVFGHPWSLAASLREAIVVLGVAVACVAVVAASRAAIEAPAGQD